MAKIKRALISLSDKRGIETFARALADNGVEILSTGGTCKLLKEKGIPVREVSDFTGFPEMLDGRVKTLHPKIHAGILARRDLDEHVRQMKDHSLEYIDLVCVNLYPFKETIEKPGCVLEDAIENIDIGGPTMVRSAAKNWKHVAIVTDSADYPALIEEIQKSGELCDKTRFNLSRKAFAHTAQYDAMISNYLMAVDDSKLEGEPTLAEYPLTFTEQWVKVQDMRYGENPHQSAAFYKDAIHREGSIADYRQLQGKELSYNNIADSDAAWQAVRAFDEPACVIVKHANPCGVAIASNTLDAYKLAFATDPTSAFGGIIAFNKEVDEETAKEITGRQFMEVIMAPSFTEGALAALEAKKNVRVLVVPMKRFENQREFKRVEGGLLVQSSDIARIEDLDLKVVSERKPTDDEMKDLIFLWKVVQYVKSNAVIYGHAGRTLGIGAGQMSRVDSTIIAARKAKEANLDLTGAAAASDAFFPFRDGVDVIAEQGIKAIIHPGGSIRDEEVIQSANEHGMAMVFTGVRHFRH